MNRPHKPLPPFSYLKEKLAYCPDTGIFTWKVSVGGKSKAGKVAGKSLPTGYRVIRFRGEAYYAHRIAWLFISGNDPGELTVDHKNRNTDDNRASNLRLASQSEQNYNQGLRRNNTSGTRGVHYCNSSKTWIARAWSNGRLIWTGKDATKEGAARKREEFFLASTDGLS